MRKKYLSALLFGALLVTSAGTFTSCKDYDDDINNLQEQIDKLATKEDMEAKLSQMQSAIDAAKTTAEEALAKAEAAGDSEEVNDLKERVAALEEAMAKVETLKAEIKSMVDDELADFREEMKEFMKEVEELTGYSLTMITEISFADQENDELNSDLNVNYARVDKIYYPNAEVYYAGGKVNVAQDVSNADKTNKNYFKTATSYVFGEGLTGEFTIKDKDVNTVKDNMLVKVAPVDAAISSDMVSLINGKGDNLNDYVNMSVASWSENIIGTRSAATGLYTVGVQLKNDVDFEAFDKMVLPEPGKHDPTGCRENHKYNMFALAVSDSEKSRTVTSDYAVTLHVQKENEAKKIYDSELVSSASNSTILDHRLPGTNDNDCFEIVLGESFDLNLKSEGGRIMASYVVVDTENGALSTTDKVAIESLSYEGVNTVSRENKHSLKVSGSAGVAVPMKLVTVDYTGIVKENIFWVKASTPALMTAAYTITPAEYVSTPTAYVSEAEKVEFKIPESTTRYEISLVAGEDNGSGNPISKFEGTVTKDVSALKYGNSNILKLYKNDKETLTDKLKDVSYAQFVGQLNLQAMREGTTYTGVIKFFNGDNYLGANTIKLTKSLPTDVPADFSAKTNTIVNGVMTIYPTPIIGDNQGKYNLTESFNHWKDASANVSQGFGLTIKGITDTKYDNTNYWGYYKEDKTQEFIPSIDKLHKDKIGEDGKTYPATVKYNYGDIKFIPAGHGVDANANHTVEWSNKFDMRIAHWIKDSKFQWTTDENPVVTYGVENMIYGKVTKTTGTDGTEKVTSVENVIEVIAPNGDEINPFADAPNKWLTYANKFGNGLGGNPQNVTIILKTVGEDGTERTNEFFTAEFATGYYTTGAPLSTTLKLTPVNVSESTTVGNDVETKVYFEFEDEFGITHNIHALTFTMKYKKN